MPIHHDTGPDDAEMAVISAINILAREHGCRIIDIDLQKKWIQIDGPPEAEAALSAVIDEILIQLSVQIQG